MSDLPKALHIYEQGPREGFQFEKGIIPTDRKIELVDALSETGLKEIAIGSFASPKWTPQMACIEELIQKFNPKPGVRYTYSVFNDRGRQLAKDYTPPLSPRIREYGIGLTMCEVFALRNVNRTQAKERAGWPKQVERAKAAGVSSVVFDRGGFHYHGRVAAFADALREGGLEF